MDLHVHTCLSPCADVSMTPDVFLEVLRSKRIDSVAITDHNTCSNVRPFKEFLEKRGISVLPGVEVTTREEVHVLGYFEDVDVAERFSEKLEDHIPDVDFDPEVFGYQILVDSEGNFVGLHKKPLFLATDLSLEEAIKLIRRFNGAVVLAHIDRAFGAEYQLGFIPDVDFDAVEVRKKETFERLKGIHNVITSSDAHVPDEIGSRFIETGEGVIDALRQGNFSNVFEILGVNSTDR